MQLFDRLNLQPPHTVYFLPNNFTLPFSNLLGGLIFGLPFLITMFNPTTLTLLPYSLNNKPIPQAVLSLIAPLPLMLGFLLPLLKPCIPLSLAQIIVRFYPLPS